MAHPPLLLLLFSALSSLLLLCSYVTEADLGHGRSFGVAAVEVLKPGTVCSSSEVPSGSYLPVIHRHGPCSPSAAVKPDLVERLARDSRRVASLQRRISRSISYADSIENDPEASDVSIPAKSGEEIGSGDYVVTVGFGTPAKPQTVIFDTGSSVCWIQCQPCTGSCYQQIEPIFDPSSSSSYRNVSCDADACTNLESGGCSDDNTCTYNVRYGDQSTTSGYLATETLTLSPRDVFRNFVFGCGEENQGLFKGVAGLLGFARSPSSLVAQTSKTLGDAFSYCLPVRSSAGYLSIGKSSAAKVVYTPLSAETPSPEFYFIDLVGISVGRSKLPVAASAFRSGDTIIDSGTVVTRLPASVYSALSSAVRRAMSQYKQVTPVSILDTCYDFTGVRKVAYPTVTLHYDGGADVALDLSGIFVWVEESVACLAFAGNSSPGQINIIGNIQQRGMEVIYDVANQQIGFAAGACR